MSNPFHALYLTPQGQLKTSPAEAVPENCLKQIYCVDLFEQNIQLAKHLLNYESDRFAFWGKVVLAFAADPALYIAYGFERMELDYSTGNFVGTVWYYFRGEDFEQGHGYTISGTRADEVREAIRQVVTVRGTVRSMRVQ